MRENIIPKEDLFRLYVIEKKTMTEIASLYNCSLTCISSKIKRCKFKEKASKKYINQKFGQLTVIRMVGYDGKSHLVFECLCDCGNTTNVRGYCLLDGNTKSCGCTSRQKGKDHKNYAGYEEISSSMWWTIKKGATSRNIKFDITMKEAWELFLQQNRKCALTGIDLCFAKTRKSYGSTTASLDRIDSKGIYELSNVQWVHKKINQLKWDFTIDELVKWCQLVVDYNTGKVEK